MKIKQVLKKYHFSNSIDIVYKYFIKTILRMRKFKTVVQIYKLYKLFKKLFKIFYF